MVSTHMERGLQVVSVFGDFYFCLFAHVGIIPNITQSTNSCRITIAVASQQHYLHWSRKECGMICFINHFFHPWQWNEWMEWMNSHNFCKWHKMWSTMYTLQCYYNFHNLKPTDVHLVKSSTKTCTQSSSGTMWFSIISSKNLYVFFL